MFLHHVFRFTGEHRDPSVCLCQSMSRDQSPRFLFRNKTACERRTSGGDAGRLLKFPGIDFLWKRFEKREDGIYNIKLKTMQKSDDQRIKREFWQRQGRQFLAVAVAMFLVLFLAAVYKRSDLFGEFSKGTLMAAQLVVIAAFIGFTAFNWRCPACKKYLGPDISRALCRKCGARLR